MNNCNETGSCVDEKAIHEDERAKQTEAAGLVKPYAYHNPSDDGLQRITKLCVSFSDLDRLVQNICPGSRARSEAITHLESAAMWAIKSVVITDPKSTVQN